MPSDHLGNVARVGSVKRFSAQDLDDDACAFSSDDLDPVETFRQLNARRNMIYPMDMRDFRRLVEVPVPAWKGHRDRPRRADPLNVVYFIQAFSGDGPIKIGTSTIGSMLGRFTTIQVGNPIELRIRRLLVGDWRVERGMHSYFAEQRTRQTGEWFWPSPELLEIATNERERADGSATEAR